MPRGVYKRTNFHKSKISFALKGRPKSQKHVEKVKLRLKELYKQGKLKIPNNKGVKRTEGQRKEMSRARIGKKFSEETKKKMSLAAKGKKKKPFSDEHLKKLSLAHIGKQKGEKCHFWKGGITPENRRIRQSIEYKLWRKAVYERDNYTCVWCGVRGGKGKVVILNADHIKPFAYFPELRFAIDNGRTLCVPCHKTTETYMKKEI